MDAQEEDFWNTPGAPARTLHFTGDLLTDEQLDISGYYPSLTSPFPTSQPPTFPEAPRESRAMQFAQKEPPSLGDISLQSYQDAVQSIPESGSRHDDDDDRTVILANEPTSEPREDNRQEATPTEEPPSATLERGEAQERKARFKVTTELERIVVRLVRCHAKSFILLHHMPVENLVYYGRQHLAWAHIRRVWYRRR